MEEEKRKVKVRRIPFRRTWLLLPIDIIGIFLAYFLSFGLRFSWKIPQPYEKSLFLFLITALIVNLTLFLALRMYTRIWRYASLRDMKAIWTSVVYAAFIIKLVDLFLQNVVLPLSIWMSSTLLILAFVGSARMTLKAYGTSVRRYQHQQHQESLRVLIYGAGSAGSIICREAEGSRQSEWNIVGFIDDDLRKHGLILHGLPVLGSKNDLPTVLQRHAVDRILIAIPSIGRNALGKLVEELSAYKVPVLIVPPFVRWAISSLFSQVRPVQVEDLLGRDPLPVDTSKVGGYIKGGTILVTGAGGSIGSEICRQVAALHPKQVVLLGRGENSIFEIDREMHRVFPTVHTRFVVGDIRDTKKMSHVFETFHPDVVFHAAAHKHVPLMEEHPDEALMNNVFATKTLAELAVKHGVQRFVMISSDKAVRPTNVMGASKRVAEMVIQEAARKASSTRFVVVRFGNVLGSRGSVVRVFKEQIEQGGPVTVTDERMMRYFMTIPEAVRLVVEAGAIGTNGHVYLLDMGEPVKIMDLAQRMIRLSGFEPGIDIPIQVTGIRPGEKLFEELSRESDSVSVDKHDRIWTVQCPMLESHDIHHHLQQLQELYKSGHYGEIATELKRLAWWEPTLEQQGDTEFEREVVAASRLEMGFQGG